ncbi:unnamed protein product [Sphagnum troendelagicum]|uniref:GRAS family transcription factor n=1 Tax=Sphagnum troendelagicum TaxID=128251 RepID=A0ABP0TWY5_9BRYO
MCIYVFQAMAFSNKQSNLVEKSDLSPLTTKLQQAWLQSQLPKVQKIESSPFSFNTSPKVRYQTDAEPLIHKSLFSRLPEKFVSPLLYSYSNKDSIQFSSFPNDEPLSSKTLTNVGDLKFDEKSEPNIMTYIDAILMEEDVDDKLCMALECKVSQALQKEFANLIGLDFVPPIDGTNICGNMEVGAEIDSNNESLDINQLPQELFEDHLVHECGNILGENDSQNEYISAGMTMCLPHGGEKVQHNVDFTFEFGDDNHLPILLLKCGEAIEQNDLKVATQIITKLRELSSPNGNGVQRMAHYITNALVAKMSGAGAQLYTSLDDDSPSVGTTLRTFRSIGMDVPYMKFGIQFCTTQILDAFKGAKHVHVIDYGIQYGLHWPCLIQELGKRPEGPPHLRITGIDHPREPNSTSSERVQETGERLAKFAKLCGVPFEYVAIAKEWENITIQELDLKEREVLAVNCFFRLRHLLDNQVVPTNPRLHILKMIRTMNPKVFVTGVENASCNEPFFISRLSQTIKHYSIHFDTLDVVTSSISEKHRIAFERIILGRQILNIIACEGTSRVERFESYKHWQRCIQRSGFIQKPLPFTSADQKVNYEYMLGSYDKRFGIGKDDGWVFIGWKNAIMCAFSTWKPIPLRIKV